MGKEVDKNVFVVSVLGIVAVFGVLAYLSGDITAMASRGLPEYSPLVREDTGRQVREDLPEYSGLLRVGSGVGACLNKFKNEFEGEVLQKFCECAIENPEHKDSCREEANGITANAGRFVPAFEGREELYFLCKKAWGGDITTCSALKDSSFNVDELERCVGARKRETVEIFGGEAEAPQLQRNERAFTECARELELGQDISAFQNA